MVGFWDFDVIAYSHFIEQIREIHARRNRQVQGSPEAAVDLHQDWLCRSLVELILQHGNSMPAQWSEEPHSLVHEVWANRCTLPQHTDAAGWRFLAQPSVAKGCHQFTVVKQHKKAHAGPDDALLDE